jgi:hypothetical protein
MATPERRQDYPVLEYKLNALGESVKELSSTVEKKFEEVTERLETVQGDQQTNSTLLRLVVGNGEPGAGRLGQAEKAIDALKRYWWQFAGGVAVILYVLDLLFKK